MKQWSIWILVGLAFSAQFACKKPVDKTGPVVPTLADTLRATCTSPFEGRGDSSKIYLPTAFSPNGDGVNDSYRLIGKDVGAGYFSSVSIKIYDTTGTVVYQSTGAALPQWDGTDQNTHGISTKYKFYVRIKYTTARNITDSGNTYLYLLSGHSCVTAVVADTSKYRFPTQFDLSTGYNASWGSFETYCH